MNELLTSIDRAYQEIQNLQLQPTKNNLAIIMDVLQVLENSYNHLKECSCHKEAEKEEPEIRIEPIVTEE